MQWEAYGCVHVCKRKKKEEEDEERGVNDMQRNKKLESP